MKVIQGHDRNAVYVQKLPYYDGWTAVQYLGTARIPTTVITVCETKARAIAAVRNLQTAGIITATQVWVKEPDKMEPVSEVALDQIAALVEMVETSGS